MHKKVNENFSLFVFELLENNKNLFENYQKQSIFNNCIEIKLIENNAQILEIMQCTVHLSYEFQV